MYCNQCGSPVPADGNFCHQCGSAVPASQATRPLLRPRAGRKLAGVCAAIAANLRADLTLVRVLWVAATICFLPFGVIAYLVAWIMIPEEPMPVAPAVHVTTGNVRVP